MKIASYPEKVDFCKGCDMIKNLIICGDERFAPVVYESAREIQKKIILAIDDNREAIDLIKRYLESDYHVVGLLSGEEAVEKAKSLKPLAITLDIMMPRKDGWQVLRELKSSRETQDIPVIILSIVDDQKQGFSLGAAEYLVKPIDKVVLLQKLQSLERMNKIKRILIVDNEAETARMIGNVLKEAEYQVTTVYNSADAVKSVNEYRPDLILLNPVSPEVGFDVMEYLKTRDDLKDIPVIIVTQKDLTEKEIDELNGSIQGILNRGDLTKEALLRELKDTISRVDKQKKGSV